MMRAAKCARNLLRLQRTYRTNWSALGVHRVSEAASTTCEDESNERLPELRTRPRAFTSPLLAFKVLGRLTSSIRTLHVNM